jgi:hypothetical protein
LMHGALSHPTLIPGHIAVIGYWRSCARAADGVTGKSAGGTLSSPSRGTARRPTNNDQHPMLRDLTYPLDPLDRARPTPDAELPGAGAAKAKRHPRTGCGFRRGGSFLSASPWAAPRVGQSRPRDAPPGAIIRPGERFGSDRRGAPPDVAACVLDQSTITPA